MTEPTHGPDDLGEGATTNSMTSGPAQPMPPDDTASGNRPVGMPTRASPSTDATTTPPAAPNTAPAHGGRGRARHGPTRRNGCQRGHGRYARAGRDGAAVSGAPAGTPRWPACPSRAATAALSMAPRPARRRWPGTPEPSTDGTAVNGATAGPPEAGTPGLGQPRRGSPSEDAAPPVVPPSAMPRSADRRLAPPARALTLAQGAQWPRLRLRWAAPAVGVTPSVSVSRTACCLATTGPPTTSRPASSRSGGSTAADHDQQLRDRLDAALRAAGQVRRRPGRHGSARPRRRGRPRAVRHLRAGRRDREVRARTRPQVRDLRDAAHPRRHPGRAAVAGLGAQVGPGPRPRGRACPRTPGQPAAAHTDRRRDRRGTRDGRVRPA